MKLSYDKWKTTEPEEPEHICIDCDEVASIPYRDDLGNTIWLCRECWEERQNERGLEQ
jgi:hypothetical protein